MSSRQTRCHVSLVLLQVTMAVFSVRRTQRSGAVCRSGHPMAEREREREDEGLVFDGCGEGASVMFCEGSHHDDHAGQWHFRHRLDTHYKGRPSKSPPASPSNLQNNYLATPPPLLLGSSLTTSFGPALHGCCPAQPILPVLALDVCNSPNWLT